MGRKITIDCATLVNKAFEVIEAHWLFDTPYEDIDVVVHRESIVHSMVEFADGSVKAQLGPPDMRFPIQYALLYPERTHNHRLPSFDPVRIGTLTFEAMNSKLYPSFELALEVGRRGGTWPAALMGADEVAVGLFLDGQIKFTEIPEVIRTTLADHAPVMEPSLDDVIRAADWASRHARTAIGVP